MIRKLRITFALSALILIAAVHATAQDPAPTPVPVPNGEYTMTVTMQELPTDMPEGMRKALAGKWEFAFGSENRFELAINNKPVVQGRFTLANDSITLTDEKGVISCAIAPGEETGTYHWKLDATQLTFKASQDKCEGRKLLLMIHPWTRIPPPEPKSTPTPKKPS